MPYLTINQAAAILPARPHRNTVVRWMQTGCDGMKLRSVRFGGKRLTSEKWVEEFIAAVSSSPHTARP